NKAYVSSEMKEADTDQYPIRPKNDRILPYRRTAGRGFTWNSVSRLQCGEVLSTIYKVDTKLTIHAI
ncbi:MAG TPA: hypothetical protein PK537_11255, partial [Candidatus Limiplasma sp.]|nr:hypothetical protein [Candidatus Limiplasma sp.]